MSAEFVLNLGNRSVCVVVACVHILVHKDLFPQMGFCNVAVAVGQLLDVLSMEEHP
jgi:hypothetical protein